MDDDFFELVKLSLAGANSDQLADLYLEAKRLYEERGLGAGITTAAPTTPSFRPGDRVKTFGNITPGYMRGRTGTVQHGTQTPGPKHRFVRVPVKFDLPLPGKFEGRSDNAVGVPSTCLQKI